MPQAFGCNAILTVYESVLLALKQTSGWRVGRGDLDRASDALAVLGLTHLADRKRPPMPLCRRRGYGEIVSTRG